MSKEARRSFSQDFKLKIIERMDSGDSGTALSIEFLIKREILYRWRDAYRAGGIEALRSKPGRPPRVRLRRWLWRVERRGKPPILRRHSARSPNCSAKSGVSSWIWIFSSKPCGT